MRLTSLADAARESGLKVIEVNGWKTRGHGEMVGVRAIVCHHTAGPSTGNFPSLAVVRDGRPGLRGPLAHLGLGRDGTVYVIAAGLAYHAGEVRESDYGNARSIGIEAEATGIHRWPAVQMDAYVRLCRALCDHYDVPVSRVLGHKEVCAPPGRKTDPNFDMGAFRAQVEDEMTPKQARQLDGIAQAVVSLAEMVEAIAEGNEAIKRRITKSKREVLRALREQEG